MRAWYKPGHEPGPEVGRPTTPEDYSQELRRLDRHDLKELRDFWQKELKLISNEWRVDGLEPDIKLATTKLARLNAEIERRNEADGQNHV
jgi:hypothetical protein